MWKCVEMCRVGVWEGAVIYTAPYVPCGSAQTMWNSVESEHVVTKMVSWTTFCTESVLVCAESKLVCTDPHGV